MRKKGKKIKHCDAYVPTCAALLLNKQLSISERMAVFALTQDFVTNSHYNTLWDCHAMLAFASRGKDDEELRAVVEISQIALENIRDRWEKHGTIRATGEEIKALQAMTDFSERFWLRQSGKRFAEAYFDLHKAREAYRQLEKKEEAK
jgi:hypothetical protein